LICFVLSDLPLLTYQTNSIWRIRPSNVDSQHLHNALCPNKNIDKDKDKTRYKTRQDETRRGKAKKANKMNKRPTENNNKTTRKPENQKTKRASQ
jgi:hypothetical protein